MDGETALLLSREMAERLSAATIFGVIGTGFFGLVAIVGLWGDVAIKKMDRWASDPTLYTTNQHIVAGRLVIELHPHGRTMSPFVVVVPAGERDRLLNVNTGAPGRPPEVSMVLGKTEVNSEDGKWAGMRIQGPVTPTTSAYIWFAAEPTEFSFGQFGDRDLRNVKPTPVKR